MNLSREKYSPRHVNKDTTVKRRRTAIKKRLFNINQEEVRDQEMQKGKIARSSLYEVKSKLVETGIHWVIFAGAAAYCYGNRRKVTDVDILVKIEDLEKARNALKNTEGFDIVADLKIKTNQGTCLFFMDKEMVERAKWKKLFGMSVPVISVEDNIVFKAILQRGEDKGKHDIEDIQHMAANEKIDLEYLKKRIKKCYAEKRVKPLLTLLGIL
ncbi:nucleotidyltransferase family protein [Candidatus Bathyarchaeota archaeon]|jgi:predicted nucleotidyltransferase|nr:nucleotidyltransferase family protein [Candidatus Bathyarchaeota archaeon]